MLMSNNCLGPICLVHICLGSEQGHFDLNTDTPQQKNLIEF